MPAVWMMFSFNRRNIFLLKNKILKACRSKYELCTLFQYRMRRVVCLKVSKHNQVNALAFFYSVFKKKSVLPNIFRNGWGVQTFYAISDQESVRYIIQNFHIVWEEVYGRPAYCLLLLHLSRTYSGGHFQQDRQLSRGYNHVPSNCLPLHIPDEEH